MTAKTNRTREDGVSLIEVLISFSLVTFLVLSLVQITIQALLIKKRSETSLAAAALAGQKAETLKSQFYAGLVDEGAVGEDVWKHEESNETFLISWNVRAHESGLLGIEVDGRARSNPSRRAGICLLLSGELGF